MYMPKKKSIVQLLNFYKHLIDITLCLHFSNCFSFPLYIHFWANWSHTSKEYFDLFSFQSETSYNVLCKGIVEKQALVTVNCAVCNKRIEHLWAWLPVGSLLQTIVSRPSILNSVTDITRPSRMLVVMNSATLEH